MPASFPSGLWVPVPTTPIQDVSNVASVNFINLAAFRTLRLTMGNIVPVTDSVLLGIRTSTNNGSSYDSGATDYNFFYVGGYGNASGHNYADSGSPVLGSFIQIADGISASAGLVAGEIIFHEFNQARYSQITGNMSSLFSGGLASTVGGGARLDTTARNALSLVMSSGNIASGYVILEGIPG